MVEWQTRLPKEQVRRELGAGSNPASRTSDMGQPVKRIALYRLTTCAGGGMADTPDSGSGAGQNPACAFESRPAHHICMTNNWGSQVLPCEPQHRIRFCLSCFLVFYQLLLASCAGVCHLRRTFPRLTSSPIALPSRLLEHAHVIGICLLPLLVTECDITRVERHLWHISAEELYLTARNAFSAIIFA